MNKVWHWPVARENNLIKKENRKSKLYLKEEKSYGKIWRIWWFICATRVK